MKKIKFVECNDGRVLRVGDTVVSRESGVFEGLFGKIIDITNAGKWYDVHCAFMRPILKHEQKELEERFSATYDDDEAAQGRIPLGDILMKPDDLYLVQHSETMDIYVLKQFVSCPDQGGNHGHSSLTQYYSTLDIARWNMRNTLETDRELFLYEWMREPGFYEEEIGDHHYTAGVRGQNKRYTLYVDPITIAIDELFAKKIAEKFPQ